MLDLIVCVIFTPLKILFFTHHLVKLVHPLRITLLTQLREERKNYCSVLFCSRFESVAHINYKNVKKSVNKSIKKITKLHKLVVENDKEQ